MASITDSPTQDGYSKEGTTPITSPSSHTDFELSPTTKVGVGSWDLNSASRKVNDTQGVSAAVVNDQEFLVSLLATPAN
jgi:hypothetical protein